jgi:hypothetical protein
MISYRVPKDGGNDSSKEEGKKLEQLNQQKTPYGHREMNKRDIFQMRGYRIGSVILFVTLVLLGVGTPFLAQVAQANNTYDPNLGAVLPKHRVVAFYGIPGAEPTGPAYTIDGDMLNHLRQQADAYQQLDPAHPVQPGIDLVVSVPDGSPGPNNTYSHHIGAGTIQKYIDFCQRNNLLLFLDLNFGQAPIMDEVNFFLPYLEKYPFVHMAVDPEWMFPRRDGIPGINLSNVRASDLNPIIRALASIPMQYHVPRKILIIHQYRSDGDTLANPYDAGQAEIADKRNIIRDPRVDVVIHIDSVGGYPGDHADKIQQYTQWVQQDMQQYRNFQYGGFKLFYKIEAKTSLMTPREVLSLAPPPMVVTYGN